MPSTIEAYMAGFGGKSRQGYNERLGAVDRLYRWMLAREYVRRSPVELRRRKGASSRLPHIFSKVEATKILAAARALPDLFWTGHRLRGRLYHGVFALLYALGLRVGEALRLRVKDVDWDRQLLEIRGTKFGKSRLVPFGPKVEKLLRDYVRARCDAGYPMAPDDLVFSFTGKIMDASNCGRVFRGLLVQVGLQGVAGASRPRQHDLRHSFAVNTLVRWYRTGEDPGAKLVRLSTFMGHASPVSTATYLTVTDKLLDQANRRFCAYARPILPVFNSEELT